MVRDQTIVDRNQDLDEELAGVLLAISVISKRLARKLTDVQEPQEKEENHARA